MQTSLRDDELRNVLALTMVSKVGSVLAKNLIAYCGSAGEVFRQRKELLNRIPGIGVKLAQNILSFKDFARAEAEVEFIRKHGIRVYYYLSQDYPHRLKEAPDAPVLLYQKGGCDLNATRMLAVVGTRKATDYGKSCTERIIDELQPYGCTVVSGLAYGIDYAAHKASLKFGLPTVGVLAHGLDKIYPAVHRNIAVKMLDNGGLLTEYPSGVDPDRERFPARNRIVAGLVDGLLLVETARKGGALITAEIASSYDREIFAVPGRTGDEFSAGCNHFIKVNKASLVESGADIAYLLGWDQEQRNASPRTMLQQLTEVEKIVYDCLHGKDKLDIDTLAFQSGYTSGELSFILLEMEFKGIIQALPGKYFRLT